MTYDSVNVSVCEGVSLDICIVVVRDEEKTVGNHRTKPSQYRGLTDHDRYTRYKPKSISLYGIKRYNMRNPYTCDRCTGCHKSAEPAAQHKS